MLAADAELDTGPGLAPARRRDLDQFADALDIDADERVGRIDALVDIGRQEASGIVAAHPERGLRQIVGPRSEEHTSELQSLMRISYAVFCLKKKKTKTLL